MNIYLEELKKYLEEINFALITRRLVKEYDKNPMPDYDFVKAQLNKIRDIDIRDIFKFFLLGDTIPSCKIEKYFSEGLIKYLLDEDILKRDEQFFWMNNYLLIPYKNRYFFVSNVYYYPTCSSVLQRPYIGPETYMLAEAIINKVNGKCLDLCTGSGIQAVIASVTANKVVAVDCDQVAIKIAKINVILNGLDEKIQVCESDLYSELPIDCKFDYIVSNPPFMPIPTEVYYPICGDGGKDGHNLVKKIIEGTNRYLSDDGMAILFGQTIDYCGQTVIEKCLNDYCNNHYKVVYVEKIAIDSYINRMYNYSKIYDERNVDISLESWKKTYEDICAKWLYTYYVFIDNKYTENTSTYLCSDWNGESIPYSKLYNVKEQKRCFVEDKVTNTLLPVTEDVIKLLELSDGRNKLNDIISMMPLRYKLLHGGNFKYEILNDYINVLDVLETRGIVFNVGRDADDK